MSLGLIDKIKLLMKLKKLYNIYLEVGMTNFFRSKKAMALIIGVVTTVLINVLGLPEESVAKITDALTVIFSTYIIGQSAADGLSKGHTSSTPGSAGEK